MLKHYNLESTQLNILGSLCLSYHILITYKNKF